MRGRSRWGSLSMLRKTNLALLGTWLLGTIATSATSAQAPVPVVYDASSAASPATPSDKNTTTSSQPLLLDRSLGARPGAVPPPEAALQPWVITPIDPPLGFTGNS